MCAKLTRMADPRLQAINLNLLTALDALLAEGNVTRAAARTGVTQSAMSHSLRQLREVLDDALFVRGPGGLVPTPRAIALKEPVRRGLLELSRALSGEQFDPMIARRVFTASCGDFFSVLLLPPMLSILRQSAPLIDIVIRPSEGGRDILLLEAGELDASVVVSVPDRSSLRKLHLFRESFVCIARRDHPSIGEELTLNKFVQLPHALISPRGSGPSYVDEALSHKGLERRIALRVPYFMAAPLIISQSDMILTVPKRIAEQFSKDLPLRIWEPPLPLPSFDVQLVWHERDDADASHIWLRNTMKRAAADVTTSH